jgi:hypothetical protein
MATGPMQFGADNNAGFSQTVLRSDTDEATLKVQNEETTGPTGGGIEVLGGLYGVTATCTGTDSPGVGIGGKWYRYTRWHRGQGHGFR